MKPTAVGTRVELVRTNDEYTHLRPGALGTVTGFATHEGAYLDDPDAP